MEGVHIEESVILMLPGWQDSGPNHWQTLWLKKYPNSVKVIQKDFMFPKKSDWVQKLNEEVEKHSNNRIILVGHSLACATIAHWSSTAGSKTTAKIKGALLVSPFDNNNMPIFPKELVDFFPMPLEQLKFKTIVVTSNNDPWVSLDRATDFAKCWGSQLVNIGPCGHINTEAGFGEWPEGEKLLGQLLL